MTHSVPRPPEGRNTAIADLLRLFIVLPSFGDGIPRIRDGELARRLGITRTALVEMAERERGSDPLAGTMSLESERGEVHYFDTLGTLLLAGQTDTSKGREILVAMIRIISAVKEADLRAAVGDGPLPDLMEWFEGATAEPGHGE